MAENEISGVSDFLAGNQDDTLEFVVDLALDGASGSVAADDAFGVTLFSEH